MKRACFLAVWVALAVSFPCGAMAAESWPADAPAVPQQVRRLMQDRNYAEAVKAIDAAVASPDAAKDYLTYLKGQAFSLAKQYDQAAAVFDAMQKDFPKSPWLRRARLAKATALANRARRSQSLLGKSFCIASNTAAASSYLVCSARAWPFRYAR